MYLEHFSEEIASSPRHFLPISILHGSSLNACNAHVAGIARRDVTTWGHVCDRERVDASRDRRNPRVSLV